MLVGSPEAWKEGDKLREDVKKQQSFLDMMRTGQQYAAWCKERKLRLFPLQYRSVISFIVFKVNAVKGSAASVFNWMAQLKHYTTKVHRQDWLPAVEHSEVVEIAKRLQFLDERETRRVKALTHEMVSKIHLVPGLDDSIVCIISTGHDGLLRGAELAILVKELEWEDDLSGFTIVIPRSKINRAGGAERVSLKDYGPTSAVATMRRFFDKHKIWTKGPDEQIFPRTRYGKLDWSRPIDTDYIRKVVRRAVKAIGLQDSLFGAHSLRAGGATDLFRAGLYYPHIKKFGRWRSDAALLYFRDTDAVTKAVAGAFEALSKT